MGEERVDAMRVREGVGVKKVMLMLMLRRHAIMHVPAGMTPSRWIGSRHPDPTTGWWGSAAKPYREAGPWHD